MNPGKFGTQVADYTVYKENINTHTHINQMCACSDAHNTN